MTNSIDGFVEVYGPSGLKQRVPEHFLDDPVLGKDLRKTPSQRFLDGETDVEVPIEGDVDPLVDPVPPLLTPPTSESTPEEIRAFAEQEGIDLGNAKRADAMLAAVNTALNSTTSNSAAIPVADDNPDAGTEEN